MQQRLKAMEVTQWQRQREAIDAMTDEELVAALEARVGAACAHWAVQYMDSLPPEDLVALGLPPDPTNPAQRHWREALTQYCREHPWR